ncbi:c-type cytochrome [Aggregatibacter actinomycetemcomitans]|uniref:cytochrome-c peroxidase n=1 Tax=Aggregatibacter actinomycetemcomitans TaxID=714 RepID=UPI0011D8ED8A|nr:cytochrome-c peroxidase [Aggregatibacter actinomycetemcomitans]TYA51424.1 c-type cytochrome [Aggregatibacter actinomycetemcomitans]TYB29604.1 c-type cytochrome [Aggregatibacter actinomycetemcomitans]
MKKFALKTAVVAIVGYLGVVGYVHQYDKGQMEKLLAEGSYSAEQQKIAKVFFNNGCQYCHTPNAELPFYAHVPLVGSMLQNDIKEGNRVFLLNKLLNGLKDPSKLSEVGLAKLERVIENDEMPIAKFLHIHWGSRPDEDEKTALLNWIREQRKAFLPANTEGADNHRLVQPIPDEIMTDAAKVALGHKLFMDGRLSGDGTIQCHTCHQLDKGGVDRLDTSTGIDGKKGGINAPTVFNAAFNFAQFWDGRAVDLADQAGGPPLNPVEMGSHSWEEIVARFEQDEDFKQAFLQVYPQISKETLTNAIGEYEKTLITPNSDFDRYLKGENTLTAQQLKGYELFKQYKCDTCHTGVNMGGQSYEYMGIYGDYFKDRGTPLTDADQGRFAQTQDPYDMHRFKVPSLHNIALTAPYMHDASAKDLKEAVRIMLKYQSNAKPRQQDIDDITSFLESLTGEFEGKKLQ